MCSDEDLTKKATEFFNTSQWQRLNFFFEQQGDTVHGIFRNTASASGVMVLFIVFNGLSKEIRDIVVKSKHVFKKNILLPSSFDNILLKKYRKLCTSGEYILKCKYCDFISYMSYTMEHMAFVHDRHYGFGLKTNKDNRENNSNNNKDNRDNSTELSPTTANSVTSSPTPPPPPSVAAATASTDGSSGTGSNASSSARRCYSSFTSNCIFQTPNSSRRHMFRDHFLPLINYRYKQLDVLFNEPSNPLSACYQNYLDYIESNGKLYTIENCTHKKQFNKGVFCSCIKTSILFYQRFHNEIFDLLNSVNLTNWREGRFEAIGYIRPQKLENPEGDNVSLSKRIKYQKLRKHTRKSNIFQEFEERIVKVYFDFFVKEVCEDVMAITPTPTILDISSDDSNEQIVVADVAATTTSTDTIPIATESTTTTTTTTTAVIPSAYPQFSMFTGLPNTLSQMGQFHNIYASNPVYYVILNEDSNKETDVLLEEKFNIASASATTANTTPITTANTTQTTTANTTHTDTVDTTSSITQIIDLDTPKAETYDSPRFAGNKYNTRSVNRRSILRSASINNGKSKSCLLFEEENTQSTPKRYRASADGNLPANTRTRTEMGSVVNKLKRKLSIDCLMDNNKTTTVVAKECCLNGLPKIKNRKTSTANTIDTTPAAIPDVTQQEAIYGVGGATKILEILNCKTESDDESNITTSIAENKSIITSSNVLTTIHDVDFHNSELNSSVVEISPNENEPIHPLEPKTEPMSTVFGK